MKPLTFDERDLKRIFRSNSRTAQILLVTRRSIQVLISLTAVYFILFYAINFSAFWQRLNYVAQAQPSPAVDTPIVEAPSAPVIILPPTISIPKLGVDAPVVYDTSVANIIDSLKSGVVWYEGTSKPSQRGNTVFVGHSSDFPWSTGQYKTIFSLLDKLEIGDTINLTYNNQQYTYGVVKKIIVSPIETSVLHRTVEPTITLLTCYPVGSTRSRLIIQAQLVTGSVTENQTTEPVIDETLVKSR